MTSRKKKYELTGEKRNVLGARMHMLYRIKALIDIPNKGVKAGDLGGFVESEKNLSHKGTCWVAKNAYVYGTSRVSMHAIVTDNAIVKDSRVTGKAEVSGQASILYRSLVSQSASVTDFALVTEGSVISGRSIVSGNAIVQDKVSVAQNAAVHGYALVSAGAHVEGNAIVQGGAFVFGDAFITGNAILDARTTIGDGVVADTSGYITVGPAVKSHPMFATLNISSGTICISTGSWCAYKGDGSDVDRFVATNCTDEEDAARFLRLLRLLKQQAV